MIRKGDILDLDIEDMAFGGRGVARQDGFVIFVSGAVPGDRAHVRITRKKKDYGEASLVRLISPSRDRVEPPCPYSEFCGGCQWQHLKYDAQLAFKKGLLSQALERIGGLKDVYIRDIVPSVKTLAYRNKMEFSFSSRPWLLPQDLARGEARGDFALGLHVPGTFDKVLDLDACLLIPETGNKVLGLVKEYVKKGGLPAYDLKSHKGFWRFLTLRHVSATDQWMVNLVTGEEKINALEPLAQEIVLLLPDVTTVVNNITSRRAGIATGEKEVVIRGDGCLRDRIGPYLFNISANSFFQTNVLTAEKLYAEVIKSAGLRGSETVLDLYSGTGTIPVFLAGHAREVVGMEIVESAVRDAETNCRLNGIKNCRFLPGDIKETLSTLDLRPDVVIIDPPRSGLHQRVLKTLLDMEVRKMVYVSCNPATLARDLALIRESYEPVEIRPVDMFPQTYHTEAVAELVRRTPRLSVP